MSPPKGRKPIIRLMTDGTARNRRWGSSLNDRFGDQLSCPGLR